jgi:ABC-type multidrug transport system permease subunit
MGQIKRVWLITLKDLRLFAADRLALFFGLLFPFFFATAFYFVMQGVGGTDERLEIHLVTHETGGMSEQIIKAMVTRDETRPKPGEPRIVWDRDYKAALNDVSGKRLRGFIAFPADFTEGVTMGYGAKLEVVVDAQATAARAALHGFARGIAAKVGAQQVSSRAAVSVSMGPAIASRDFSHIGKIIQESLPTISDRRMPIDGLIDFDVERIGEVKAKNPSNFVIPGYLVMFVFFLAAFGAEEIVRERQNQTLERLLTSSVRRETLLGGIFMGTAVKGLAQILLFWIVGIVLFRMNMGSSPAAVVFLSLLMVLASSAFSIMLATLVRTQRAAIAVGVLTSLVLAPLGGCWWPLFITPKWMQFLARFTPHGWATTGFNKLMIFGADFSAAVPNMLALVGFTALFGIVALWRFTTSE